MIPLGIVASAYHVASGGGGSVPVFRSATLSGAFTGSTTVTIAKPAGATTGDLALIGLYGWSGFYQSGDSDNRLYATGFTPVEEIIYGNAPAIGLYRRQLDGSEGSTFTCGFDGGSNRLLWCALIEAGTYNTSNPIDTWAMARDTGTTAAVDAPSISPTAGRLSLGAWLADADSGWTVPSGGGWTERLDAGTGSLGSGLIATREPAAGATGTQTATAGGNVAGSEQAAGWQVSINPA